MIDDKIKLRQSMLLLRKNMPINQKILYEKLIIKNFIQYFAPIESKIIAGFKAIKNEPNLDNLYSKLIIKNTMCFPRIIQQNLHFGSWDTGQQFVINKKFQTMEPIPKASLVMPDILLVPLLAADIKGNRLGYGGGFYDRYLHKIRKIKEIISIGICFEFQMQQKIPIEENDQKLDYIVTNNRIIKV